MHDDFSSLYAFNRWANGRMLDACRKLTSEQYAAEPVHGWSSVRSTVTHIAIVTEGWLRGLTGGSSTSHRPIIIASSLSSTARGAFVPSNARVKRRGGLWGLQPTERRNARPVRFNAWFAPAFALNKRARPLCFPRRGATRRLAGRAPGSVRSGNRGRWEDKMAWKPSLLT